jgi:hypothetical protein
MLNHRELKAMAEWQVIAEALGDLFAEHTQKAICEERDLGNVRYHKGWVDAINEFIDLLERLFPVPNEVKLDDEPAPGEQFVATRKDGSIY